MAPLNISSSLQPESSSGIVVAYETSNIFFKKVIYVYLSHKAWKGALDPLKLVLQILQTAMSRHVGVRTSTQRSEALSPFSSPNPKYLNPEVSSSL